MVALEAWFDSDAEDPTIVRTSDELDAVLDTIAAWPYPGQLQLLIADNPGYVVLDVGLNGAKQRGVLFYSNQELPDAYASQGSDTVDPAPIYYYMGSDTEFPATAEIPLADVRRAAHEYMSTGGGRPHDITWQVWTD
ncbi:Imm1 family immunity protein [Lentzea albidocapillata]|uniref:Immunity protein Imm1 n=1 Tax=Lentzea albidocapillata TaxID=40571 RepID=A0A1W2FG99_9PSEU|nr:Imm1 family immunity protein [Lentzea albidocapillata]SMD20618.1 Immunity protein Imm1 [Lentzea albidocapillata]